TLAYRKHRNPRDIAERLAEQPRIEQAGYDVDRLALLEKSEHVLRTGRPVLPVVHADEVNIIDLLERSALEVVPGLRPIAVAINRPLHRLKVYPLIAHGMRGSQKSREVL